jgi:tellurite resistance protein
MPTMTPHPVVQEAVASLCTLFDAGGYSLTPIIDLGALVANADGSVDASELEMLRYLFQTLLGSQMSKEMVEHLVRSSLQVILEAGVEARAALIAEILLDCDAVEEGLTVALAVAYASEGLAASERAIIELIGRAAELPSRRVAELIETVGATLGAA